MIKTSALLFLLSAPLWSSELVPIVCQGNNQFAECALQPVGGAVAILSLNLSGTLGSGPVAQSIFQTQSIDFTTPAQWAVTDITVFGSAQYSGYYTSVGAGITSPCAATIQASFNQYGFASCGFWPAGIESGTVTAYISVRSDAAPLHAPSDLGHAAITEVVLSLTDPPVTVPEPGTGLLLLLAALVLPAARRARVR